MKCRRQESDPPRPADGRVLLRHNETVGLRDHERLPHSCDDGRPVQGHDADATGDAYDPELSAR